MGSNRKRTNLIRDKKSSPNKINLKKNKKRIRKNFEILKELASDTKS